MPDGEDQTTGEEPESTPQGGGKGPANIQEAYQMGKAALEAAGGNYLGAAKDFIKGGGGKWLFYGCGGLILVVGGFIALIVLAFLRMGEPTDFMGFSTRESIPYGTGITAANREEVADKINDYIDNKTSASSPLIGLGMTFIDSGDEKLLEQYYGEEYSVGVNVGLIMAIAYVETNYATDENIFDHNAFAAIDPETGELLEYGDWELGVQDQGRYILANYVLQGEGGTLDDIAEARGEGESWADAVEGEMNLIFIEIPELRTGGAILVSGNEIVNKALEYVCANSNESGCGYDTKGGEGLKPSPFKIPYWKEGKPYRSTGDHCGSHPNQPGPTVLINSGYGVDCSGLVSRVLREIGILTPNECGVVRSFVHKGDGKGPLSVDFKEGYYLQKIAGPEQYNFNPDAAGIQLMPGDLIVNGGCRLNSGIYAAYEHEGCVPHGGSHITIYIGKDSAGQHFVIESTWDVYDGPQQNTRPGGVFSGRWIYGIYRIMKH